MKKNKIKIAVLTVFYKNNCEDYFLRYFDSINKLISDNLKDFEIDAYVLDNSPVARLKKYILDNKIKIDKNIKIIEKDLNGFAPANNYLARLSYRKTKCDYFFILNPDTEVNNLLFIDSKNLLYDKSFFSVDFRQYPFEHPKKYDLKTLETSWCSGACELVDSKKFFKMGGFDERFFMYAEDVDLSWKAWEAGYKCFYQPNSSIVHNCYGLEKNALFRQYWGVRNGIIMRFKHGNLSEIKEFYKLLIKPCFNSFRGFHLKEFLNLKKALLFGTFNGLCYLKYFLRNKKRPSFACFNGFEYAKIIDKYDKRK